MMSFHSPALSDKPQQYLFIFLNWAFTFNSDETLPTAFKSDGAFVRWPVIREISDLVLIDNNQTNVMWG